MCRYEVDHIRKMNSILPTAIPIPTPISTSRIPSLHTSFTSSDSIPCVNLGSILSLTPFPFSSPRTAILELKEQLKERMMTTTMTRMMCVEDGPTRWGESGLILFYSQTESPSVQLYYSPPHYTPREIEQFYNDACSPTCAYQKYRAVSLLALPSAYFKIDPIHTSPLYLMNCKKQVEQPAWEYMTDRANLAAAFAYHHHLSVEGLEVGSEEDYILFHFISFHLIL